MLKYRKIKGNITWIIIIFIYSGLLIIPPIINGSTEDNQPAGIREAIVNDALSYRGSNESNFDCSGFTRHIYKIHGINLPLTSNRQYIQASEILSENNADIGDLIFFRINSKKISHVGIYLGNSRFIHSPGKNKVIRIDSLDGYWKNKLAGFRTLFPDN